MEETKRKTQDSIFGYNDRETAKYNNSNSNTIYQFLSKVNSKARKLRIFIYLIGASLGIVIGWILFLIFRSIF